MGPGAPPAPAQERRAPTLGAALLPTGSGPAPTRLLSYDAVMVGRAQTRPCRGSMTEGVQARKSMSVAYRREYKKAYFRSTGRGNGATGVHRAFSDGYQGASIEHSLMDTRESPSSILKWTPRGKQEHKMHNTETTVCAAGNSHACFAHVIEISSRIIVGVPARKPRSASTKRKSEKCISRRRTPDEGMGPLASIEHSRIDTRESPSSIL